MCSVKREDGNQSCVPLYSGTIWQKSLKIYTTLLHTAAASQCSQRRTLGNIHHREPLFLQGKSSHQDSRLQNTAQLMWGDVADTRKTQGFEGHVLASFQTKRHRRFPALPKLVSEQL